MNERTKRHLFTAARLLGTVVIFAWLFQRVPVATVGDALTRLSAGAVATAALFVVLTVMVGVVRWGALLRGYGADAPPGALRLIHLYWVGFFYTLWVPGGVVGDLVRGVASRESFTNKGATAGLSVVFVERVCGLIGLFAFVGTTFALWPLPGIDDPARYGLAALAIGVLAIAALEIAPRIAERLPGILGRIAGRVPTIARPAPVALGLGLSLLTHLFTALTGHVLMVSLAPEVPLTASLTIVSLAAVSAFFPLSQGGAGVREAAFAFLYGLIGVPEEEAIAGGLALFGTQLAVASLGGIAALIWPVRRPANGGADVDTSQADTHADS